VSQPREQLVHLRSGGLNKQDIVLAIALFEGCSVANIPAGPCSGSRPHRREQWCP
jgi:hypothetical protein